MNHCKGGCAMEDWVIKINDILDRTADLKTGEIRSICRVPDRITNLNKKAYKPQTVSLGPYHHGEEHLLAMEEHKHRALLYFLKRSNKPLELYVKSLASEAESLKKSYDSLDPCWLKNTDAFLQLMIIDGSFMLEILRTAACPQTLHVYSYARNDPIFGDHGRLYILPHIRGDMLMLENQLPMRILYILSAVENGRSSYEEGDMKFVNKAILKFCFPNHSQYPSKLISCGFSHSLDLYRKRLLWVDPFENIIARGHARTQVRSDDFKGNDEIIPSAPLEIMQSAMELSDAGIQFKVSNSASLKDISFRSGVLTLPLIVVDDAMESIFLNLIALESLLHLGWLRNEVTSYIFLMNNIVDNASDVSFLHSLGIIQNAIGSDKAVAKLFNSFPKDVTLDPTSTIYHVHREVIKYCNRPLIKWRANINRNYFRNPWAFFSFIVAIILNALTFAQTIYTIYPYYTSNHSPGK